MRSAAASTRWLAASCGILLTGPLLILPLRAIADEWRAPAVWPQELGRRGLQRVLEDPVLPQAIANSSLVGLLAIAMGLAVAWPAARTLRRTSAAFVFAPLLMPPLVIGEGLQVWFLRLGLADSLFGVALAHLVFVVPYMVIILAPGFTTGLTHQEEAAHALGGSRWDVLRFVTFPGMASPLALALAMGFTVSWSQYGTSLGVGGGLPMLPLVLVPFVRSDPQIAAVLDLIFLVPPLLALTIAVRTNQRL